MKRLLLTLLTVFSLAAFVAPQSVIAENDTKTISGTIESVNASAKILQIKINGETKKLKIGKDVTVTKGGATVTLASVAGGDTATCVVTAGLTANAEVISITIQ